MIDVGQVDEIISGEYLKLKSGKVDLENCEGRILREDIYADRDFPPFNRVMMDGIAINYQLWQDGQRSFAVEGLCPAGSAQATLLKQENCLEVMTGAVMPANTDTVVPYEQVKLENGRAEIEDEYIIKQGQHIHLTGTDRTNGDLLMRAGRILTAAEVATLATVGYDKVVVAALPKIAVIATGDELVDVDVTPLPHQIRKSNVHSLLTSLRERKFNAEAFHITDNKDALRSGLKSILEFFDVIILSGGVSKGKLDYVPEILAELGVKKLFHFVKQRPGKPFWFGRYNSGVVFALPGNPVSTFVGMTRYVLPFLYRSTGIEPKEITAVLGENFTFKPELTYFLQVKLEFSKDGKLIAMPVPGRGSGDLANLLDADGFLELPAHRIDFKSGETYRCLPYRQLF